MRRVSSCLHLYYSSAVAEWLPEVRLLQKRRRLDTNSKVVLEAQNSDRELKAHEQHGKSSHYFAAQLTSAARNGGVGGAGSAVVK